LKPLPDEVAGLAVQRQLRLSAGVCGQDEKDERAAAILLIM
jgi:hypothetical protein